MPYDPLEFRKKKTPADPPDLSDIDLDFSSVVGKGKARLPPSSGLLPDVSKMKLDLPSGGSGPKSLPNNLSALDLPGLAHGSGVKLDFDAEAFVNGRKKDAHEQRMREALGALSHPQDKADSFLCLHLGNLLELSKPGEHFDLFRSFLHSDYNLHPNTQEAALQGVARSNHAARDTLLSGLRDNWSNEFFGLANRFGKGSLEKKEISRLVALTHTLPALHDHLTVRNLAGVHETILTAARNLRRASFR